MPEVVCQKREFAVRSSSCEINNPNLKNKIFVRIDIKHSYFSKNVLLLELLFAKN